MKAGTILVIYDAVTYAAAKVGHRSCATYLRGKFDWSLMDTNWAMLETHTG
jgi:hypothetical protein